MFNFLHQHAMEPLDNDDDDDNMISDDIDELYDSLESKLVITKKKLIIPKILNIDIELIFLVIQLKNKERRKLTKILTNFFIHHNNDDDDIIKENKKFIDEIFSAFKVTLTLLHPTMNCNTIIINDIIERTADVCRNITENVAHMFVHGPNLNGLLLTDEEYELIKNTVIVQGGGFKNNGTLHNCILCGNERILNNYHCINCRK